jgi:nucleotide-binding universal stress UspA family protein
VVVSFGAGLRVIGPDESKPWFARILEGRVARHLVDHAKCPVAVVPDMWEPSRDDEPVVVIVDDEPLAQGALAFAFETAERRHVELRILHVAAKMQDETDAEWSSMKWIVDTWQQRFPDVRESSHIVTRDVHAEAVSAGSGAGLLVVGRSRSHGAGNLLGASLARDIISVSDCPVVVVPTASVR